MTDEATAAQLNLASDQSFAALREMLAALEPYLPLVAGSGSERLARLLRPPIVDDADEVVRSGFPAHVRGDGPPLDTLRFLHDYLAERQGDPPEKYGGPEHR